jgi:hypothetical protein
MDFDMGHIVFLDFDFYGAGAAIMDAFAFFCILFSGTD